VDRNPAGAFDDATMAIYTGEAADGLGRRYGSDGASKHTAGMSALLANPDDVEVTRYRIKAKANDKVDEKVSTRLQDRLVEQGYAQMAARGVPKAKTSFFLQLSLHMSSRYKKHHRHVAKKTTSGDECSGTGDCGKPVGLLIFVDAYAPKGEFVKTCSIGKAPSCALYYDARMRRCKLVGTGCVAGDESA